MNRIVKATLASAALALAAGTSFAQAPQAPQQPRAFSKPTERVEARLAYVRTALKITEAQQPQWNAYANSVRQSAAQREKKFEEFRQSRSQQPQARPSAVERLERQQRMLTEAAAQANARLAAVKPLYDSLNPEQKKVADVVLVREGRGGRGHGHMHHRRA